MLTKDDEMLCALELNPETAPLDRRRRALVDYALKLTVTSSAVNEQDIAFLREAGFSDLAIHDAAVITSYFNFVNRFASGLGVDLEEEED